MNYGILSAFILVISLLGIFISYERKKTSLKEISLIATLSALAGIGRVPFAAFPNVQPTTFLIMVSGYVLGPGHGFVVGAFATLVSNTFLGHGPWEPWQMLAWGLVGFSSGLMGKIRRTPSRIFLSIFAFFWGFAFDYIMNLWHWLFFIYPLNLKSFIAINAASFYLDMMHAAGNFVFTFFFGKDFILILSRFKKRLSYMQIVDIKNNNENIEMEERI